ncbi:MAG: type III-B CRISPR module-associated protein Cmr3 [Acidobacteria bacterium]|nr:type III-B CRISPR module-associated protein Cmr3 [Acidobacteriota bacterium]
MSAMLWTFEALDRLFFRDGRPMNIGEMTWVESQFPPTGRTLQGAVRTAVLQSLGVDFESFRQATARYCDNNGEEHDLTRIMGCPSCLGELKLTGPFLTRNGELLFPAPLDLVKTESGGFEVLCVKEAEPIECDLGRVVFPRARETGVKTQESKYLTTSAMQGYLAGNLNAIRPPKDRHDTAATLWPLLAGIREDAALANREPKMGLERNDGTRTAEEGMLYSIAFVRPRMGVALALVVEGIEEGMQPTSNWLQPLGGEGKLAGLTVSNQPPRWPDFLPELQAKNGVVRFKLVLSTPALFDGRGERWLPGGFTETPKNGLSVWSGVLNGVDCEIISACVGKPQKIGGWDIANNRPRDLTCYVPSGSVYFCRAEADQIEKLHGGKIGLDTEYGFGHVLVGTW